MPCNSFSVAHPMRIIIASLLFASVALAACPNACSQHGLCVAASQPYCVCEIGWLGADCSIGGAVAGWFTTSSGAKLIEFVTDASNYVHVRLTFQRTGYFGMIFNPQPDGMTNGDCWALSVTGADGAFNTIAQDRFSHRRKTPKYDAIQSLENAVGYVNGTNQVIYFKRALQNTDTADKVC